MCSDHSDVVGDGSGVAASFDLPSVVERQAFRVRHALSSDSKGEAPDECPRHACPCDPTAVFAGVGVAVAMACLEMTGGCAGLPSLLQASQFKSISVSAVPCHAVCVAWSFVVCRASPHRDYERWSVGGVLGSVSPACRPVMWCRRLVTVGILPLCAHRCCRQIVVESSLCLVLSPLLCLEKPR
jgi:hypothetical protein